MRTIFRARHADPRGAVPRVSDRRRRRSPQAGPAPRRNDREPDPVGAMAELTAGLPLPLGYSLGRRRQWMRISTGAPRHITRRVNSASIAIRGWSRSRSTQAMGVFTDIGQ